MSHECTYETMQYGEGNPLFMRDGETLTAKPKLFDEILYSFLNAPEETITSLCGRCGLCNPEIEINVAKKLIQIRRNNYFPIIERRQQSLLEIAEFEVPGDATIRPKYRIAIVDDNFPHIQGLGRQLANRGFSTFGAIVQNSYYPYEHLERNTVKVFQAVIDQEPTHILCDKNFQAINGRMLSSMFKQSVWTFLVSGEQNTREGHEFADVVLEKARTDGGFGIEQSILARPYPKFA